MGTQAKFGYREIVYKDTRRAQSEWRLVPGHAPMRAGRAIEAAAYLAKSHPMYRYATCKPGSVPYTITTPTIEDSSEGCR